MLGIEVVAALAFALLEIGKRKAPDWFTSDVNVIWSVVLCAGLNALNANFFASDWRSAASAGIVAGLAMSGAYKMVSSLTNRSPQEFMIVEAKESEDDTTVIKGFSK